MPTKAKELQNNPRKAKPAPPVRADRIRLDVLLVEQVRRFNAARAEGCKVRVWIETED